MDRRLGYILGGLLVARGLLVIVWPRWLFTLWDRRLRVYFPPSVNRLFEDFFGLSDATIRVIGFWVLAMGGVLLWLARKVRDQSDS